MTELIHEFRQVLSSYFEKKYIDCFYIKNTKEHTCYYANSAVPDNEEKHEVAKLKYHTIYQNEFLDNIINQIKDPQKNIKYFVATSVELYQQIIALRPDILFFSSCCQVLPLNTHCFYTLLSQKNLFNEENNYLALDMLRNHCDETMLSMSNIVNLKKFLKEQNFHYDVLESILSDYLKNNSHVLENNLLFNLLNHFSTTEDKEKFLDFMNIKTTLFTEYAQKPLYLHLDYSHLCMHYEAMNNHDNVKQFLSLLKEHLPNHFQSLFIHQFNYIAYDNNFILEIIPNNNQCSETILKDLIKKTLENANTIILDKKRLFPEDFKPMLYANILNEKLSMPTSTKTVLFKI